MGIDPPGIRAPTLSEQRLAAIQMPLDLTGQRVLELGCEEGYFCLEAKRRGAAFVLGMDGKSKHVRKAREQAAAARLAVEFRQSAITELPEGTFDLVLCLSATHEVEDLADLLGRIRHLLSANGMLILEIGVVAAEGLSAGRALRSKDERMYPTMGLLTDLWLRGYSYRFIGPGLAPAGDPITRKVFHCHREQVSVVMICGEGGIGKSSLSRRLGPVPVISTDRLMRPVRAKGAAIAPAQAILDAKIQEKRWLSEVWDELRDNSQVRSYCAKLIADAVRQCRAAGAVIVEGHVLEDLGAEVEEMLGPDYRCWSMTRRAPARPSGKGR